MISWIIFAVIALFVIRIAIIFLCPSLDDFMSGGESNIQDNSYYKKHSHSDDQTNPNDSEYIIGPWSGSDPNYSSWIGKQD